jgi:asparagine synthase (glutamine-hydrolysing)
MTAIAGWVGPGERPAEDACRLSLSAQQNYACRQPVLRSLETAAFGIALFDTLPEDVADKQPIIVDEQLFVADLRLDNREELAARLSLTAQESRTLADSTIFCLCWRKWGESCLEHMLGDYALAVFTPRERKLVLARDFTGQRPLFYAQRGDTIVFSSLPAGITRHRSMWQGFDSINVARSLMRTRPADETTYFAGIKRVMPGEVVTIQAGRVRTRAVWEPSLKQMRLRSPREYIDAYRAVLDASVRSRLRRRQGPIAAHLSSGYDSNAVASTAARLSTPGDPIIALTAAPCLGFEEDPPRGRIADESARAANTARLHRMEHLIVRGPGRVFAQIATQAALFPDPVRNIVNCGWMTALEQRAAARGAQVLLSGELGNLTLNAGGLEDLSDLIDCGRWPDWWQEARAAAKRPDLRWRGILMASFHRWTPSGVEQWLRRHFHGVQDKRKMTFLNKDWLHQIENEFDLARHALKENSAQRRYRKLKEFDYGTVRKGALAESGIDTRDPLADRRVIEFSLSLPTEQLFAGGCARPLARAALEDRLPAEILNATERGYQAADWFEDPARVDLPRMVEAIFQSPASREFIDFDKLRRAVTDWPARKLNRAGTFTQYGIFLPLTLAVGYFLQENENPYCT